MTEPVFPVIGEIVEQETAQPHPALISWQLRQLETGHNQLINYAGKPQNYQALQAAQTAEREAVDSVIDAVGVVVAPVPVTHLQEHEQEEKRDSEKNEIHGKLAGISVIGDW